MKKLSFVDQVLSKANKSEKDLLREKATDFVEDAKVKINSSISNLETSEIPHLNDEIRKNDRTIEKLEKSVLESKYTIFNSVEEYFKNLNFVESELHLAQIRSEDLKMRISMSNSKIEKFKTLLEEVFN